ncbi:hypothetical protein LJC49_09245 [Ruminococcaceae bacterium OttesenSCG-928-I18]|nr:hypothetical protein [Ruminococcaceae bacterium OttesenSCG-928-I18]
MLVTLPELLLAELLLEGLLLAELLSELLLIELLTVLLLTELLSLEPLPARLPESELTSMDEPPSKELLCVLEPFSSSVAYTTESTPTPAKNRQNIRAVAARIDNTFFMFFSPYFTQ